MRWRRSSALVVAAGACAVVACNALIGTKDIFFEADAGPPSGDDGGGGTPDTYVPPGTDSGNPPPNDGSTGGDTGQCGDTQTSGDNCGRCGHSCQGGTCDKGQCQPVTLASGSSPRDLAVDATHVYWIEPNTARAMQADKKDGANAVQLGGGTSNYLIGLDVDDASVFWGTRDEILLRCKIGGCANTPAQVSTQITYMGDLAVDGTNAYWLQDTTPATMKKSAKTGTNNAASVLVTDADGVKNYNHIATDGQNVFWTADDGKVRRVAVGGGPVSVVATTTGSADGIAIDDQNVYFSSFNDPGTINMAPKGGVGGGSVLAASQHLPLGVAVDTNSIYWVNAAIGTSQTSGTIMTCKIAACTPTQLASGQRTPVFIVVDDVAVYWSNFDAGNNGGGIMKVAKP
jgi:hypothetical protein